MKTGVFGTGYVGLVSGVCIADFGLNVTCVDIDEKKIRMLKKGKVPIYEPGLDVYLARNMREERISFTTGQKEAVENCDVLFIAVGTPSGEDGTADLSHVYSVASSVGRYMNGYKVIVNKSTVPVGTGRKVREIIKGELEKRGEEYEFDVVSNPEFLREGKAIQDFTHPDRIVIGTESEKAAEIMRKVYRPLYLNEIPFIHTNIETAEMIKYACNAFLATKITFINEIANLCEKAGANVQQVARAMGRDGRISPKFLHAGPGFGGSCFPKDTRALAGIGREKGIVMRVVEAVIEANGKQKLAVAQRLADELKGLEGRKVCLLGLTFKPETDDIREAPSLTVIESLVKGGARVSAYDPEGMETAREALGGVDGLVFCKHAYDAAEEADALVIMTEWHEFRNMDLMLLKKIMKTPVFYDTRNIYVREDVEAAGFRYMGTGT